MTTTKKYRDYSFSTDYSTYLDTGNGFATLLFTSPDTADTVFAQLDRDVAREVGTDLLNWIGSPMTCTLNDVVYPTINGAQFSMACVDGTPEITIRQDAAQVTYTPQWEAATDIGQRLIVFAGVNVGAVIESNA